MNKLVSIIIPCYNDGDYVEQAVQSILNQTYSHKEIIVIDDGSNLKTKKILKELESKIDLLITQENSGPSIARNKGISMAKGDFILTLDADDYFKPTFIEKGLKVLASSPNVGLVTCHAHIIKDGFILGEIISQAGDARDMLIRNGALANSLFRKQAWIDVQGYDEKMINGYEDWDFNISITKKGWKIAVIKEFLFNYRLKSESRNQVADNLYKHKLLKYLYLKHRDVFQDNYEKMIVHLVSRIENCEIEKLKIKKTRSYRLGKFLIFPLKWGVSLIKRG